LHAGLPQLELTLCVWHPGPDWRGATGTAAEALSALLAGMAESPDVYLCGPPKMLDTVEAAALAGHVPPERIFAERLAG
jgi:ferredoxin-NADP reductase